QGRGTGMTNFLVQWGINPWGEDTPIHAQWALVYIALAFGVGFMLAHTLFVKFWPKPAEATAPVNDAAAARVPARVAQHSLAARKAAKYPWDIKMYHTAIVLSALATVPTGLLMMSRVQTPFFTRNPYLFGDATWGVMYVLHGLSGIGLVGLTMAHIYFAIRPEKQWITKGMIFGDISRQDLLQHHDPQRGIVHSHEVEHG